MKSILVSFLFLFSLVSCNFHTVEEGKFYRSAQLSGEEFKDIITEYGIKTVINLRGAKPESDWWVEESEAIAEMGVKHINIGMSAQRLPHRDDLIALLDAYKTAERPILIHCQGGADRTGEASAIYKLLYMGSTLKQALKMLTVKYLHLKKKYPAKRYFMKKLWQGEDWAYNEYDPCEGDYKYYDKEKFCN